MGPARKRDRSPAMQPVESFLTLSEVTGYKLPVEDLIGRFANFGWRQALVEISTLAAVMANGDGEVRRDTVGALVLTARTPAERRVADFLLRQPRSRPLAHEQGIYLLASLAVLYGLEEGPTPNHADVAFFMLAANDYVGRLDEGLDTLTRIERVLVGMARCAPFNQQRSIRSFLVRQMRIFEQPPPRTQQLSADQWPSFQQAALGTTFQHHMERRAGPWVLISSIWGTRDGEGKVRPPIVETGRWDENAWVPDEEARQFFNGLCLEREPLRKRLTKRESNGLPTGFSVFHQFPFVRINEHQLACVSPWVVQAHLRTGLWAKHLAQAKQAFGKDVGPQTWFGAFGDMFEAWCRHVARLAEDSGRLQGRLHQSDVIGDHAEVEDVVLVRKREVVLFSAKSSLVPLREVQEAEQPQQVVDWYHGYLFGERTEGYRRGALHLLEEKCRRLRAGEFSGLDRHSRIYPVLVTYDDIGDITGVHRWAHGRCNELGLFQQARVELPTFMSVDSFEALMGAASLGRDVFKLMKRKVGSKAWRDATFETLLVDELQGIDPTLAEVDAAWDELVERIKGHLRA